MERIGNALRLGLRTLSRSPGFAVAAVLTLAAGVGANTAIFSLANWALLRPVPGVAAPDELVTVEVGQPNEEGATLLSHPTVQRFGLVSESVQSRTREFGIRTALGARAVQVAGLVLREGLVTVGSGAVVGLLLAWWTAGLLESRLAGMPAVDPVTFTGATLLLVTVALLVSLGPAWRSTRVDPAEALRAE